MINFDMEPRTFKYKCSFSLCHKSFPLRSHLFLHEKRAHFTASGKLKVQPGKGQPEKIKSAAVSSKQKLTDKDFDNNNDDTWSHPPSPPDSPPSPSSPPPLPSPSPSIPVSSAKSKSKSISKSRRTQPKKERPPRNRKNVFGPRVKCPRCEETYQLTEYLWSHYVKVHKDPVPLDIEKIKSEDVTEVCCEKCGQICGNMKELTSHRKEFHSKSKKAKTAKSNIEQEQQQDQPEAGGGGYFCQICGKQYKAKDIRDAHVKQIHMGENFRCDICTRICYSQGKLWRHKVEIHDMKDLPPPPGTTPLLQCEYCGKEMLRGLEAHMKKAHPHLMNDTQLKIMGGMSKAERGKLKKRELRKKLSELGAEAVTLGLVPKWMLRGKEIHSCDICGNQYCTPKHFQEQHGITLEEYRQGVRVPKVKCKPKRPPRRRLLNYKCTQPGCAKVFRLRKGLANHLLKCHNTFSKLIERGRLIKMAPSKTAGNFRTFFCSLCAFQRDTLEEMKVHLFVQHLELIDKLSEGKDPSFSLSTDSNDNDNDRSTFFRPRVGNGKKSGSEKKSDTPLATATASSSSSAFRFTIFPRLSNFCLSCKRCPATFSVNSERLAHIEECHPGECFPCRASSDCRVITHTARGLRLHVESEHSCGDCAKDDRLVDVVPYRFLQEPCPICEKIMKLESIERHIRRYHGLNEEKNCLKCKFAGCGKTFATRHVYLTHMEEYHGPEVNMEEVRQGIRGFLGMPKLEIVDIKTLQEQENSDMEEEVAPAPGKSTKRKRKSPANPIGGKMKKKSSKKLDVESSTSCSESDTDEDDNETKKVKSETTVVINKTTTTTTVVPDSDPLSEDKTS